MPIGKKERKGKIQSINFEDENYEILTREVNAINSNYSSRINSLVRYTYGLAPEIKEDLARYCHNRAVQMADEASGQPAFERARLSEISKQYSALVDLLTAGRGVPPEETGSMQRVDMANGYGLFPNDWIILTGNDPACCSKAVVIEFRNNTKYDIPHFVLFTDKEKLTEWDEQIALDEAAEKSKIYDKVRRMYQQPQYDANGNLLNARAVRGQPEPGFFRIAELGSAREYPYGAMVVPTEDDIE